MIIPSIHLIPFTTTISNSPDSEFQNIKKELKRSKRNGAKEMREIWPVEIDRLDLAGGNHGCDEFSDELESRAIGFIERERERGWLRVSRFVCDPASRLLVIWCATVQPTITLLSPGGPDLLVVVAPLRDPFRL